MDKRTPWVEKYRPQRFHEIVLTNSTRDTMNKWITQQRFPNVLFYGPPGTGKTTTAWNIIRRYQQEVENIHETSNLYQDSHNVISLNASDDKGIEILRQRIHVFVQGKPLFHKNSMKFVILDEIDHMTSHAQRMLCFILQEYQRNVRYILICNYVSHLDKRLRDQVHTLTFYGMPHNVMQDFLMDICEKEDIPLSRDSIFFVKLFMKYDCDIRSMVNALQQYKQNPVEEIHESIQYQFDEFHTSLESLESFLTWCKAQPNPRESLMIMLYYALENNRLPKAWIHAGFHITWHGQTSITAILPHQQSTHFTELVAWFLSK